MSLARARLRPAVVLFVLVAAAPAHAGPAAPADRALAGIAHVELPVCDPGTTPDFELVGATADGAAWTFALAWTLARTGDDFPCAPAATAAGAMPLSGGGDAASGFHGAQAHGSFTTGPLALAAPEAPASPFTATFTMCFLDPQGNGACSPGTIAGVLARA